VAPAALLQGGIMTDLRGFLLPSFVHSFKLAHDRRLARKPLLALITAVVLITLSMGFYMRVKLGYESGALGFHSWFKQTGAQMPGRVTKTLNGGVPDVSWLNWAWTGVGAALTYFMMVARARLTWFPLHPMGYLMALGDVMMMLFWLIIDGWQGRNYHYLVPT
jgi:hypothetical protein